MKQRLHEIIAITLTCPSNIEIGDIVEISGDLTCRKPLVAGSASILGPVVKHKTAPGTAETTCTVDTPFRERRDDRVASGAVIVGPFVFGLDNTVISYSAGSPAVVTGTTTGVKTVVVSTSDKLKIAYGVGGADQTITLTAGVGVTMAAMAAEITAQADGFSASVSTTGHLVITGDDIWKPIEIKAVSNAAYTLLGLSAAVTAASGPSHDPNAVRGLILTAGDDGDVVETLEY